VIWDDLGVIAYCTYILRIADRGGGVWVDQAFRTNWSRIGLSLLVSLICRLVDGIYSSLVEILMRHYVLAIYLILLPAILIADTIHVPADQPTIQGGVDAASAGDTVLVACGTYYEHSIIVSSDIVLRSEGGNYDCVTIDAQNMGNVIAFEFVNPIIEGFTITGGQVLLNGGGMHIYNAFPYIARCKFIGNTCTDWENSRGGGVYSEHSSPIFSDCMFEDNECGAAGAIYCKYGEPEFYSCVFLGNSASGGGAVIGRSSSTVFENCTFIENTATEWGGAIFLSFPSSPILSNCTFYGNNGGVVGGGAIYGMESIAIVVESCIAWNNSPDEFFLEPGSVVSASCSDVYGGWPGEGNISLDPLFCDSSVDDFTLRNDSPCAPNNNDCGVLMGAWPVGCSTNTSDLTWSEVKSIY